LVWAGIEPVTMVTHPGSNGGTYVAGVLWGQIHAILSSALLSELWKTATPVYIGSQGKDRNII